MAFFFQRHFPGSSVAYRDSSGFKRSSLSCYHKRYCNFLTASAFGNVLLLQRLAPCCTSQPFLRSSQDVGIVQRQLCGCAVTQNAMLPQAQHSTARRSSPKGLKSPTDKLQMARQYERSGAKGPQIFHGQSIIIRLGSRPDAGIILCFSFYGRKGCPSPKIRGRDDGHI